jgi:hypothetical protein
MDAPESEPFEVSRVIPFEEFAPTLLARLSATASRENPPRLMPHVLSYWGFDVAAYRLAARAAAARARGTREEATALCDPEPLDLIPEWPEEPDQETVIEWGIFNPLGPSINTLRLTPIDAASALVYTLYHPAGSASLVMATWDQQPDARAVAAAIGQVLARNGHAGVWLIRSIPDYVYLPAASPVTRADVAGTLAAARGAARRAGEAVVDLASHAERLRRLASDPWLTTKNEMEQAESGTVAAGRREGPGGEQRRDFLEWLEVAASPEHVAAVRSQLPVAWERLVASSSGGEETGGQ